VLYTGAGVSAKANIHLAARDGGNGGRPPMQERGNGALPTKTHWALGQLARAGLVQGWIQQNHDGLPQKAGFPQKKINEIHGAIFDPSNPVVKFDGKLKSYEYRWMTEMWDDADLVLVLGTTLSHMNADNVAHEAIARSFQGRSLGVAFVNIQMTATDGDTTLRIFEESDIVMARVLEKLGLGKTANHVGCKSPLELCREPAGYMYQDEVSCNAELRRFFSQNSWDLLLKDPPVLPEHDRANTNPQFHLPPTSVQQNPDLNLDLNVPVPYDEKGDLLAQGYLMRRIDANGNEDSSFPPSKVKMLWNLQKPFVLHRTHNWVGSNMVRHDLGAVNLRGTGRVATSNLAEGAFGVLGSGEQFLF